MQYLAPAPWRIGSDVGDAWKDSLSIYDASGGCVAELMRGYEGDANGDGCPSWTNARLISAAPDLLAALQAFMHADGHDDFTDEWPAARAAITKAIGDIK